MMVKLIAVACVLVLCLAAGNFLAADVSYGVIGGVGLANVGGADASESSKSSRKIGFSAGAFAELRLLSMLSVHPELLFCLKGFKEDGEPVNLYYIDLPVLAKFYLPLSGPVKPNLFAGPYLGYNIIAKAEGNDVKDAVRDFDYGLVFGGGVDVSDFLVDIRYELGLASILEDGEDVKNRNLALMVGFRFK